MLGRNLRRFAKITVLLWWTTANYQSKIFMISKRINIYHETGNVNHYTGLSEYCSRHDIECVFREFALAYQLKIAIKEKSFSVFLKFWVNLMFFCQLYLTKNKCIVLGAAPYDYSMMFF